MSKPLSGRIDRRALLVVTAVSFVGLLVSVATSLVLVEAPANYSGFNQSYVYGLPLRWIIIEKITAPTGQAREIIHIATAQFVADFAIWTTIVGIAVFVFERRIFGFNRNRIRDSKLTSRTEKRT